MSQHLTHSIERRKWYPLGMSFVLHAAFTLLLVCWFFSNPPRQSEQRTRRGGIVIAVDNADQPPEYLTEESVLDNLTEEAQPTTAPPVAASSAPTIALETVHLPERVGFVPAESLVLDASQMSVVPGKSDLKSEYQLSPEDLKMIEADRKLIKSRQPVGNPTSISVFGSGQLTGRDFVFVLDRSKSMGSSGLGVLTASRTELSSAIAGLEAHHHFQIVGYHDRTVTMSRRQLLPADDTHKAMVAEFIGNLVAFGGTEHENGLLAALAFQPDVIVLMTDGGYPELNSGQLKLIQRLAGDKTEIHCLQFGAGPKSPKRNFMSTLAEQNHGRFQYIDVNQWKE